MPDKPTDPHLRDIDPFEGIESEAPDPRTEEHLDDSTIERRATQGVGMLVGQMLGLQVLTLGVTIVLARTLSVSDYGVFAIALAVQQARLALVELGVPAALINRKEPPDEHAQRAVTGFVMVLALALCGFVGLLGYVLLPALGAEGNPLKEAAVATLALPILALRTVPTVLLERRLRYGRVTALYTADTIVFNIAALVGALAGWGGFALVAAVPVGALAGMIAARLMQSTARGMGWDFSVIRPLIGFGTQVGTRQVVVLARDLGFVSLISLVGSQVATGYYAMSQRVLGVPLAFSLALGRVAFPAMARNESDEERIDNAVSSIRIAAVAIGLPLAVCAGAADPLLDFLFGARWVPAADVVIPSAAGLFLMASAGSIIASLFYALGDARTPMVSSILDSLVLCGSVVFLVQWSETTGIGLAVLLGAACGVIFLMSRAAPAVRAMAWPVLRGLAVSAIGAAAGYFCPVEGGLAGLIAAAAAASLVWLALTFAVNRRELSTLFGLARRGLARNPS